MDFNSVHSPEKIKHLRRRILGLKMYRWLLVFWQFVPVALGVAYVLTDSWRAVMIVLFLLSVVLTWYLHRKIGEVVRRINVLEMTVIAYRVENGERFLPDHKDYALYRQMLFTLLGSDKKR